MASQIMRMAIAALGALLGAGCSTPPPASGVVIETRSARELGVSTRFGIVALGATQREGEVDLTAFYGDGPATDVGLVSPVSESLCRVEAPFPTPWCEISSTLPTSGEELLLAGYDAGHELWTEYVTFNPPQGASGLILPYPEGLDPALLIPGVGVYRWERERWRLVGLLSGEANWHGGRFLVACGPVQLAAFVAADHARNRPLMKRNYRRDVRPR